MSRTHRERLSKAGYLQEVIKGWYFPARSDLSIGSIKGSSAAWFAGMRGFVAGYCDARFGEGWHLSPELSLLLRSGERTLPRQSQVWSAAGNNQLVQLPHHAVLPGSPRMLEFHESLWTLLVGGSMEDDELILRTAEHLRAELRSDTTGHDWLHTERVWRMSRVLAEDEKADSGVVQLTALLHDVRDWKTSGKEHGSADYARQWLLGLGAHPSLVAKVCDAIDALSFLGEKENETVPSREAAIVQDADRLDAMGAIGIARAFAYGGSKKRPIYDPDVAPRRGMTREEYRSHVGTTVNHFHEKLLLLRDRMQTEAGRRIAEHRHEWMLRFLEEFDLEVRALDHTRIPSPWKSSV